MARSGPRAVITSRAGIVWLLTGLNLFNYLDRYVVTAVSPRIQEAMHLSDTQTGAILSAFMIGYFLTSPAFGAAGDRGASRKGLICLGVLLWSLATAGSGLVAGFLALLVARIFVGVGEASYATLSPTIIDDLVTPETRNRWLAVFYVAIPVGSAMGFGLGGWISHATSHAMAAPLAFAPVPHVRLMVDATQTLLERAIGWRSAFFLAGVPGIVLALLVLLIAEPARTGAGSSHGAPAKGAVRELRARPLYVFTVLGYVAYTFALGGFAAWAPKYLYTVLGMELKTADFWFGALLAITGLAGTAVGGWLGDAWPGSDRTRAYLAACGWVTLAAAPIALACLLVATPVAFFALFSVCGFLLFVSTAPTNAAILKSVPDELRASAMAVSIFAIHLFGDLISPPLTGGLSDLLGGGRSLRIAMLGLLPLAIFAAGALWLRGSRLPAEAK